MKDIKLEVPTQKQVASRKFQEELYDTVAAEIKSGVRREGLWAKAYADAQGDEVETRALYIRYRAQGVIDELFTRQVRTKAQEDFLNHLSSLIEDLHRAAEYGDCLLIGKMLSAGVDVNAKRDDGNTALYLASLNGKDDAVVYLLSNGADRTIKNMKGRTPVDAARVGGYASIAHTIESYQKKKSRKRKRMNPERPTSG